MTAAPTPTSKCRVDKQAVAPSDECAPVKPRLPIVYPPHRARQGAHVLTTVCGLAMATLLSIGAPHAARAEYPERPIKLVVGLAAGSGADILVRFFADRLPAVSGATVIVENKPGALTNIANDAVAKARPDGYTLLMGASSGLIGNAYIYKNLPYDPVRDFTPVTTFAQLGFVLTVSAQNPASSVAELTAQLKAKGGRVTYGWANTSGLASSTLYLSEAGIEAVSVPYKANPVAVSDVAAGQIDFVFSDAPYAIGQEKTGKVKLLGVTPATRLSSLPNVPTMTEAGLPGASIAPWWAVFAPAKTPPEIVAKIEGWFNRISSARENREPLIAQGVEPLPGSSENTKALMALSMKSWEKITRLTKIEPQ